MERAKKILGVIIIEIMFTAIAVGMLIAIAAS